MSENKQVQIIIRTTQEEKNIITQKAKDKGISVNEFIKRIILEDDIKADSTDNINDSNNDITSDIIELLKEQLKTKDMQIANLQQIIYNRDTKLIETSKKWWEFWNKNLTCLIFLNPKIHLKFLSVSSNLLTDFQCLYNQHLNLKLLLFS